jgi:CheY-like chemotaxis protein
MPARRILIVEDDVDVREALSSAMRDAGAEVVLADDEDAALAQLRRGPRPAVVVLDLHRPLGGEGFLAEVRADPRFERLPVITMTAGGGALPGTEVLERLRKPLDFDDLRRIVESLFDP